jgi:small subunit ribosomal protein S8e
LVWKYGYIECCFISLFHYVFLGISRDSRHKRRATGGRKANLKKKRQYEIGLPAANTKIGAHRVHIVRGRGGNLKFRAMRLETGNFSWGSEGKI